MIDLLRDDIVSLTDAAKLCPRRRGGKRPHISCLYRWTTAGCKGIVLESIQIGGTRCTSPQALARFFARLTADAQGQPTPVRTPGQRERSIREAEEALARDGM